MISNSVFMIFVDSETRCKTTIQEGRTLEYHVKEVLGGYRKELFAVFT